MQNSAIKYFESVLGRPIENFLPEPVSGWRLLEILWPLNAVFRKDLHRIRSIKYRPEFELEADRAIDLFVANPIAESWDAVSPGAWRVLLERHTQMMTVALANEAAENPITVLPSGLPKEAELPGIMLLFLRGMTLPWPPDDRSRLELPDILPPASLRPH